MIVLGPVTVGRASSVPLSHCGVDAPQQDAGGGVELDDGSIGSELPFHG